MVKLRHRHRAPARRFRVIDLPRRHEHSYFVCLEDWSDEMREAGDAKECWFEQMKQRGLRVKLAVDDDDRPLGMIQYVPIEESMAEGTGLYMVLCIWVMGYDEADVGNVQGSGIGSALLVAAEDDAVELGATGMAAWGIQMPFWMRSSWFKQHGYRSAARRRGAELVWKPFTDDAEPPRWLPEKPVPKGDPERVTVTGYESGWCPAMNLVCERAARVADEFGPPVEFTRVDVSSRAAMARAGQSGGVFVDGRPLQRGAPPSTETIRRRIGRRVRGLQRRGVRRPDD
jgi:GNAT superfamily N-acetyltransferase